MSCGNEKWKWHLNSLFPCHRKTVGTKVHAFCMLFLAVSLKHTNLHSRWLCYPKKHSFNNKIFIVAVEVKNDSVKERRSIVFAAVDEIPKKKNFAEYCSWTSVKCHWAPCVSDNICLIIINYDLNCQRSFN